MYSLYKPRRFLEWIFFLSLHDSLVFPTAELLFADGTFILYTARNTPATI